MIASCIMLYSQATAPGSVDTQYRRSLFAGIIIICNGTACIVLYLLTLRVMNMYVVPVVMVIAQELEPIDDYQACIY